MEMALQSLAVSIVPILKYSGHIWILNPQFKKSCNKQLRRPDYLIALPGLSNPPPVHMPIDVIYRVPTKVPYHPFNYRMATAISIRVVSRHGKVTMRYWMKPLTAPPGGKRRS
ncbi:hypothetical protein AVEN_15557-1 [Araneus ventricosus]|uniref:Uncharacterized protein n=1 Tax=Araneus ventricosus TaxID=182803 RepID=A0A4Y2FV06_ARAVE|nr:hypothetical protein AVEN_15557-1 [Araneus ventricosus]